MSDAIPLLRRGQIVLVSFDPAVGSEASKTRPAVVVSNNTANAAASRAGRGVITVVPVVPVTSNTTRVHEFQVLLPAGQTGLQRDAKAQAEQVRSVSLERVAGVAGWIPAELVGAIDDALRLHLTL